MCKFIKITNTWLSNNKTLEMHIANSRKFCLKNSQCGERESYTPIKINRIDYIFFNPLSANPGRWSNTLKQFLGNSQRIVWFECVSPFCGVCKFLHLREKCWERLIYNKSETFEISKTGHILRKKGNFLLDFCISITY